MIKTRMRRKKILYIEGLV